MLAEGWQHGNPDSDISEKRLRMRPEFLNKEKLEAYSGETHFGHIIRV